MIFPQVFIILLVNYFVPDTVLTIGGFSTRRNLTFVASSWSSMKRKGERKSSKKKTEKSFQKLSSQKKKTTTTIWVASLYGSKNTDTSAGTGKLCTLGHLGLVFIWSCFVSCLLFLSFYVSLRNLCSGTCRNIQKYRTTKLYPDPSI